MDDEATLIEAARGGDSQAFSRLVHRYRDTVYATVVAVIHDFDEAHDVAQETFLRAWFALHALEDAAAWPGWLRAIARNRALSWLERRRRRPATEPLGPHLSVGDDAPDHLAERGERRRLVLAALERLPEDHRQVILLHYMEDVATPEIAARLDITPAAARQRLHRARRHLQAEMEATVADTLRSEAPGDELDAGVSALIERSRVLFQQVDYRAAVPVLEAARDQAPLDSLVSMLLADAYTFARGPEELAADRDAWDRAVALLDEVVEREPGNLLARLRRAAVRAPLTPPGEVLAEQRKLLEAARDTPFEAVAELELARRHLQLQQPQEALALYEALEPRHPWLLCVLRTEVGVARVQLGQPQAAVASFEAAVEATTDEAMAHLRETSETLLGPAYWTVWSSVDNRAARQCQNHAWLAGLYDAGGDTRRSRQHLVAALEHLDSPEIGAAAPVLRQQFVEQMERMFPSVAAAPEVRALASRG